VRWAIFQNCEHLEDLFLQAVPSSEHHGQRYSYAYFMNRAHLAYTRDSRMVRLQIVAVRESDLA